jgi:ribonucleoside-diphosphate reductase alpha chain
MHRDSLRPIKPENVQPALLKAAQQSWDDALDLGAKHGYKNSQVSVLAPTGTIGFMMDCDTTGIEPDLALVKFKRLVGGGVIKIVNNTVPEALSRAGYTPEEIEKIVAHVDNTGAMEGAPGLKPEHLPVFDCSLESAVGGRSISWHGHLNMMAAAQPFLSGAISKTINMPEESTIDEVMRAYVDAWKLGLKAVAIYRNNSKKSQPLAAAGAKKDDSAKAQEPVQAGAAQQQELFVSMQRHRLPDERKSLTHKFSVAGHDGYIIVGMYDDGAPGEVFIKMAKEGSTLSGVMDGFALAMSIGLQYGVPLRALVDKLVNTRFEPSGFTRTPEIRMASSVLDYIARWLGWKFISPDYIKSGDAPPKPQEIDYRKTSDEEILDGRAVLKDGRKVVFGDAPTCSNCGMLMTPNGSCYKCENCGGTSGCS